MVRKYVAVEGWINAKEVNAFPHFSAFSAVYLSGY